MSEKFTDKVRVTIFEPRNMPVRGMSSFMDASALGPGWYQLLQNVRTDKGTIRVRDGHAKKTSTALNSGTGTFGGAGLINYSGTWVGNPIIAAAAEISSATQVHVTNTGTSFGEATAGSGQYGNTRFGTLASGDGRVYFASGYDRLTNDSFGIFQNGTANPRIYSINNLIVCGHYTPTPPSTSMQVVSRPRLKSYWNVFSASAGSPSTPTGTSMTFTETASSVGDNYLVLAGTNPVQNDQALYTFTSTLNFTGSRQLVAVINGSAANLVLLDNVKIEVGNSGGTYFTVHDASTSNNAAYAIDALDANNNYVVGFNFDTHSGTAGITTMDRIRVTWVGSSVTGGTFSISIYVLGGSGRVPGNALHAYTYANSISKAESIPQFVTQVRPRLVSEQGGTRANALTVGNSSKIFYDYDVNFLHTTSTERDLGTDKLYLYRQDENDTDYFYVATTSLATYSGSWSFVDNGSTSALGLCVVTDTTLAKNYLIKCPDPENINIPIGKAMCYANGRLFVAKSASGVSNALYISDHRYPTRFRTTPNILDDGTIDIASGTIYEFPGEVIQQIISSSVGYGGDSFVYVFTDLAIYMLGRNVHQIQKVASFGTLSPRSVCEYLGTIVFLASDRSVRVIQNGQTRDISDRLVEDILKVIPASNATTSRITKVAGGIREGKYYLGYSPVGATTNTRCLVYDFEEQKWYDDLFAEGTGEEFVLWVESGKQMLCHMGSNLHLYETEKVGQTQDNATTPTISITTPEFKLEEWHKFSIGRVGVVCDDVTSGSIAVSRSYSPGSNTPSTSSISVDVTTDEAWKYDGAQTLNDASGYRGSINLSSSTLLGGTHIREIAAEFHPRRRGAG